MVSVQLPNSLCHSFVLLFQEALQPCLQLFLLDSCAICLVTELLQASSGHTYRHKKNKYWGQPSLSKNVLVFKHVILLCSHNSRVQQTFSTVKGKICLAVSCFTWTEESRDRRAHSHGQGGVYFAIQGRVICTEYSKESASKSSKSSQFRGLREKNKNYISLVHIHFI